MAAKILANIIIAGAGVLVRAGVTAYRQAIINGQKAGMNPETLRQAAASKHKISVSEAQKILEVHTGATLEEIRQRYEHLFAVNEKHGTFYLQSKVYRAYERLEAEIKEQEADAKDAGKT
mmetsp:Transcript_27047/g.68054  ORF Transcript_27047/g.68054 Transcript_27047/m.68054 type:complete len:120 (-) Transcript_27047:360-719(-)|eukprot:jgi/Tetstr1/466794/TSEL_011264.t1